MAHIVEAEAALDAEPVLVRRSVAAADVEELVVLDVVGELAADPAIGAHAVDRAVGEPDAHVRLVHQRRRHQRAGRTGLHAFAAGDAGRGAHRVVEVEHDLFAVAAEGHADHIVDLHLAAGADAEIALDAGVEIDRHRRMAAVGNGRRARRRARLRASVRRAHHKVAALAARFARQRGPARKPADRDLLPIGGLPELRLRIVRHVLRRLIRQQQLDHHLPRALGAVGLGLDLHARRRRADAARGEHALALDLHHADAAIAVGTVAGLGQVAQMRQLDPEPAGGTEDGLAGADLDLAIVDAEGAGLGTRLGGHGFAHSLVVPAKRGRQLQTGPCAGTMGPRLRGDDSSICGSTIITNSRAAWPARQENTSAR